MRLLRWLLFWRRRQQPAQALRPVSPPVDLDKMNRHLTRTDHEMEKGARELDYLRYQVDIMRRQHHDGRA